jgi:NADH-ubiquinone oxidoreductase chain 1
MTEHAAGIFVFFFLAEYASIILICILISIVFLGGYEMLGLIDAILEFILPIIYNEYTNEILNINNVLLYNIAYLSEILSNNNILSILYPSNLAMKFFTLVFLFILIRASYPRLRFDKLMSCC